MFCVIMGVHAITQVEFQIREVRLNLQFIYYYTRPHVGPTATYLQSCLHVHLHLQYCVP